MSDTQGIYNGRARSGRNSSGVRGHRFPIGHGAPGPPKRNGAVNPGLSRGNTGSVTISFHRPKWYAYRLAIIVISAGSVALAGIAIIIGELKV